MLDDLPVRPNQYESYELSDSICLGLVMHQVQLSMSLANY